MQGVRYEHALKVGDTQSATENLRRFFDQRFSENEESYVHPPPPQRGLLTDDIHRGLTQHALLNLARLHYSVGETLAACYVSRSVLRRPIV